MSSFKSKITKKIKINKKNSITLDNKHNEILNNFNKEILNQIPLLKEERANLRKELSECSELNTVNIEKRLDMTDKINDITQKIKDIKNKKK